jgi:hypothetical protein
MRIGLIAPTGVPVPPPVVTTAHGPFDATLGPVYRAMRGVAVVAISYHQAATADGVPLAGVIHHGLDLNSVPLGRGDGGYASFLGRMSPDKGARQAALIARAAGVRLRLAAKLRDRQNASTSTRRSSRYCARTSSSSGNWASPRSWSSSGARSPW